MDRTTIWNPREVLNLQATNETTWRCAGIGKNSRRCTRLIRRGEAKIANLLLDNMSRQMPDQIDYDDLLQLAHACLCTKTSESHRDSQIAGVIYRWTEAMANESCLLRAIATPLPKSRGLSSGSAPSTALSSSSSTAARHEMMARQFARTRSAFCSTPIPMDAAEVSSSETTRKAKENIPLWPVLKQSHTTTLSSGSAPPPASRISPSEIPPSPPPTPTPTPIAQASSANPSQSFADTQPSSSSVSSPRTGPETAVSPPHTPIQIQSSPISPLIPSIPSIPSISSSPSNALNTLTLTLTPAPMTVTPQPHQSLLAAHQSRLQSRLAELQTHFTTLHLVDHARLTGALHLLLYALQVAACVPLAAVMLGEGVGTLISELLPFAWDDTDEESLVGEDDDDGRSWKSRSVFGSGRARAWRHGHLRRQMSFGLGDWTWVVNLAGDQRKEIEKRKRRSRD